MSKRIIYQFAPQICKHDAIGNEILAIQGLLRESGIESRAVCDFADEGSAQHVRGWSGRVPETSRLTIVHYSHGSPSHERVFASPEPKVLFYHNVTPAHYFRSTHPNFVEASEKGRRQLASLPGRVDIAVAHSSFSAEELRQHGFDRVEILPYVSLESLYEVEPDASIFERFGGDGWINLICVAQVAPHKCIEDCILVFDYFRRMIHRKSRLFVVGGWNGTEAYLRRLQRLVKMLGLDGVIFTGQVSQAALIAYYQIADALLCMSEHEGFCVPLIEAMRYDVPIFAYEAAAVPETLRYSGVLFARKHWPTIAEAVGILLADPEMRAQVVAKQRASLDYYSLESCRAKLAALLESVGITA
ncbi:MAG: glycosyltransferase family 4 protein [Acidobacteriia bacterium]|nr:glycosyltransferase family 4 protein [Terriglobia bacterium]